MNIYYIFANGKKVLDYDSYDSHVIVEKDKESARDECPYGDEGKDFWINPKYSNIVKIDESTNEGYIGVIVSSFNAS